MLSDVIIRTIRSKLDYAADDLKSANILFDNGQYRGANIQVYHCILNAMNALLELDSIEQKKANNIAEYFMNNYILNNTLDKSLLSVINIMDAINKTIEYDEFPIFSLIQTKNYIEGAKVFINTVEFYINNQIKHQTD